MSHPALFESLSTLLPTLPYPPPQPLISLSLSLLAQSRTAAPYLRAEEEIARPYACVHIACERLKNSLNLPSPSPRPPIPPAKYDGLYSHLTTLLAPRKRGRPRKEESQAREKAREAEERDVDEEEKVVVRPLRPILADDEVIRGKSKVSSGQKGTRGKGRPKKDPIEEHINEAAVEIEAIMQDEERDNEETETIHAQISGHEHDKGAVRGFGSGSMLQGKTDYLSPSRRHDYSIWRADMLQKIEQIEKEAMI